MIRLRTWIHGEVVVRVVEQMLKDWQSSGISQTSAAVVTLLFGLNQTYVVPLEPDLESVRTVWFWFSAV